MCRDFILQEFFDGNGEELAREGTLRGAFFEERGKDAAAG